MKRFLTINLYCVFLTALMFVGLGVNAQVTTSSINGKVKDAKGMTVPGASVLVIHVPTGTKYGAVTGSDGYFRLNNLNPGGPYKVTVTYIGYNKQEKEVGNLGLGVDQRLDFTLADEGQQLSEVTVKGKKGALKTGAGTQIGEQQIRNMPSTSRSLTDVTRVTPQVSKDNSFMGTNFRYNNVTIDGAINNDAIGFSPSLGGQSGSSGMPGSSTRTNPVSIDAIQDVQVLLAPYDVKVGNFTGGSVNAVTRSGTNDVTGSVYGFGRNASLIGKNKAGDGAKEPDGFHEYQTGFRVGLPLIKNKLFFFTNEEITRRQDPVILGAGSSDNTVVSLADATAIANLMKTKYGVDVGAYKNTDNYNIYSRSNKFFNRLDWNINDKNQLTIRNNTITSTATNLERDQSNFRFSGIDYVQTNNQNSTVAELKSRISNNVSNSLVVGYSSVHDYRTPTSDAALPQIQIASNGGTIYLGTDREASIFNMKQKTTEFTDNITVTKGRHTFTFGTHNELYNITYGFVNSWNGRVDYSSVANFLAGNPSRVRTNYNYSDNSRDYILNNPPAQFHVNMYSVYGEDQFQMTDRFKLTYGLRFDMADMPNKQPLSDKTTNAPVDPNYGTTYTYTKPNQIKNDFFGQVQISPRVGFNFDILGDQSLIMRGGTGLFTGRVPFAWLGYAYYNNGVTYGSYDNQPSKSGTAFVAGTDPIKDALTGKGEAGFVANQGVNVGNAKGATQVDLIDNNFKMPKTWRSSLAFDFKTDNQWKFTAEGIFTKVIHDLMFQQINYVDNPTYLIYDTQHQQPIFSGAKINSLYTNAYLLSNTSKGYRYSVTGQISKSIPSGFDFMAAYTFGQSKDVTNGIRNSMESNWQLNQALNPNNPGLANSNFDIRNRIVSTVNYRHSWDQAGKYVANFSLFFSAQSGTPYSYGFVNSTIDGTGQQVSLVYIPKVGETAKFFGGDAVQAAAFDAFIDGNSYLKTRRGEFTERNAARTPWNYQADFRFSQDFRVVTNGTHKHVLSFTYDIVNLTNLLNKNWGVQTFSPNTFNSMASVGLSTTTGGAGSATAYPTYTFKQANTSTYSKDFFASRYQMQFGLRYSF